MQFNIKCLPKVYFTNQLSIRVIFMILYYFLVDVVYIYVITIEYRING